MHSMSGMTSLVLATALLIRTQSPGQDVALELRDPFSDVEREVRSSESLAATGVKLPSELVDPFTRRAPARALSGSPRTVPRELVDPFANRRSRAEKVPSKLSDPFTAKSPTVPAAGPNLVDPFARQFAR
jgi:hypothetical protein